MVRNLSKNIASARSNFWENAGYLQEILECRVAATSTGDPVFFHFFWIRRSASRYNPQKLKATLKKYDFN